MIEDIESEAYSFSDLKYHANAVTNNLSTISASTWLRDPITYETISLYKGGSETIYIHLNSEDLKDGQTFDYFTITYRSGSNYDDKKTIWFSLK